MSTHTGTGTNGYMGIDSLAYETVAGTQGVATGMDELHTIMVAMRAARSEGSAINEYTWMDLAQYEAYVSLCKAYKGDTVSCSTCNYPVTLDVHDWIEATGKCTECDEVTTFYNF